MNRLMLEASCSYVALYLSAEFRAHQRAELLEVKRTVRSSIEALDHSNLPSSDSEQCATGN